MQNCVRRNRGKGPRSENNFHKKHIPNKFETLPNSRDPCETYSQYYVPDNISHKLSPPSSRHLSGSSIAKFQQPNILQKGQSGTGPASKDKKPSPPYKWEVLGKMYHLLILEAEGKKMALIEKELKEIEVCRLQNLICIQMLKSRMHLKTSQASEEEEEILRLLDKFTMISFPQKNRDQIDDDAIEVKAIEAELKSKFEKGGSTKEWDNAMGIRDQNRQSQDRFCKRLENCITEAKKSAQESQLNNLLMEIGQWGYRYSVAQENIRKMNSQILDQRTAIYQQRPKQPSEFSQKQQPTKESSNSSKGIGEMTMGARDKSLSNRPQSSEMSSPYLQSIQKEKRQLFNLLSIWRKDGEELEAKMLAFSKLFPQIVKSVKAAMRWLRERHREGIKPIYRKRMEKRISNQSSNDSSGRLRTLVDETKEVQADMNMVQGYLQCLRQKLKEREKKVLELQQALQIIREEFPQSSVTRDYEVTQKMKAASGTSFGMQQFIAWLIEFAVSEVMKSANQNIKYIEPVLNHPGLKQQQIFRQKKLFSLWIQLSALCTQSRKGIQVLAPKENSNWMKKTLYDKNTIALYERFFGEVDRFGRKLRELERQK